MFQKNSTEKEVGAIFLWLGGIIVFYTLVFIFILEPSSDKAALVHHAEATSIATTHKVQQKATVMAKPSSNNATPVQHQIATTTEATHKIQQKESTVAVKKEEIPAVKIQTVKKVVTPVEKKKEVVKTVTPTPTLVKVSTPVKTIKVPTQKIQTLSADNTKTTTIPVVKVPTVPTVPTVSTPVQAIKSVQPKAMKTQKILLSSVEKKIGTSGETQKVAETKVPEKKIVEEKIYDRDANMKLLETARQHIIEKAETARAEAMKGLGR